MDDIEELEQIENSIGDEEIDEIIERWGTILNSPELNFRSDFSLQEIKELRVRLDQCYTIARWELSLAKKEIAYIDAVWDFAEHIYAYKSNLGSVTDRKNEGKAKLAISKYNIQHTHAEAKVKILEGVVDVLSQKMMTISSFIALEKIISGENM